MRSCVSTEAVVNQCLRHGSFRPVQEAEPLQDSLICPQTSYTDEELLRVAGHQPLSFHELHRLSVLSDSPLSDSQIRTIVHEAFRKLRKKFPAGI